MCTNLNSILVTFNERLRIGKTKKYSLVSIYIFFFNVFLRLRWDAVEKATECEIDAKAQFFVNKFRKKGISHIRMSDDRERAHFVRSLLSFQFAHLNVSILILTQAKRFHSSLDRVTEKCAREWDREKQIFNSRFSGIESVTFVFFCALVLSRSHLIWSFGALSST